MQFITSEQIKELFNSDTTLNRLTASQGDMHKFANILPGTPADAEERKYHTRILNAPVIDYLDATILALIRGNITKFFRDNVAIPVDDDNDDYGSGDGDQQSSSYFDTSVMPPEMLKMAVAEREEDDVGDIADLEGVGYAPDASVFAGVPGDDLAHEIIVYYSRMGTDVLFDDSDHEFYTKRRKNVLEVIRLQKIKRAHVNTNLELKYIKSSMDFLSAIVAIIGKPGFSDLSPAMDGVGVLRNGKVIWGDIEVDYEFYPHYLHGVNTKTKVLINNPGVIVPYLRSLDSVSDFCVSCAYRSMYITGNQKYKSWYGIGHKVDDFNDPTIVGKGAQIAYLKTLSYYALQKKTPKIMCFFQSKQLTRSFASMVNTIIQVAYRKGDEEGLACGRELRGGNKSIMNTTYKEMDVFSKHKFSVTAGNNVVGYCSTSHKARVLESFLTDKEYTNIVYIGVTQGPNMHYVKCKEMWDSAHETEFNYGDKDFPEDSTHYVDLLQPEVVANFFQKLKLDKETVLVVADVANDEMSAEKNDNISNYLINLAPYCDHVIIKFNMFQKCEFNHFYSPLFVKSGIPNFPFALGTRRHNGEAFAYVNLAHNGSFTHVPIGLIGTVHSKSTKTVITYKAKWDSVFALARESNCTRGMVNCDLEIDRLSHNAYYPNKKAIKKVESNVVTNKPDAWTVKRNIKNPNVRVVCGVIDLKIMIDMFVYQLTNGKVVDAVKFTKYLATFDQIVDDAMEVDTIPGVELIE